MALNTGRLLRINLTTRKTATESVPESVAADFIGGRRGLLGNGSRSQKAGHGAYDQRFESGHLETVRGGILNLKDRTNLI